MSDKVWHIAVGGQQQGPFSLDDLQPRFQSGELSGETHVFTAGMDGWEPARKRPELAAVLGPAAAAVAAVPPPPTNMTAHEIDYEVFGEEMQFVEITLDPQEAVVAEAGSFMYMEPNIQMETIFGDGSGKNKAGGVGKMLLGAVKRKITGESLFMTVFGNTGGQRQKVAFASPYPGCIVPVDLTHHSNALICQKDSFLCAAKGVSVGIAFQRKILTGLFGGEGFILQKLEGDGMAFIHACGVVVERTLAAGETLRLDTGCLVAFEQQVGYDIQQVPGIKSKIFGGEGFFYASLTGPGKVWVQSLPFSRLAGKVFSAAPQTLGGASKGEGSVLAGGGLLGGIAGAMMGDE